MRKRPAWWLLPNLLSIDAIIVAVVWMWILAKSMRVVYVEAYSYWLVSAAIWVIYVLDRIMDVWSFKRAIAKKCQPPVRKLSPRHHFHWNYRFILLPLVAITIILSIYSTLNIASEDLMTAGLSGFFLVILYGITAKIDQGEVTYFKNLIAGITFAFGVSAPIVLEGFDLYNDTSIISLSGVYYHFTDASSVSFLKATEYAITNIFKMTISSLGVVMFRSPLPLLFALLCFLNMTAIDLWQKSRETENEDKKEVCETIIGSGFILLVAFSVYLAAFSLTEAERVFAYAVMISTALLQILNKNRRMFYLDAQRTLADLCLILPVPVIWMLS